jgi:hypothetical protein
VVNKSNYQSKPRLYSLIDVTICTLVRFGVVNGHYVLGEVSILSLADLLNCFQRNCVYRSGLFNILLNKNKQVVFRLVLILKFHRLSYTIGQFIRV